MFTLKISRFAPPDLWVAGLGGSLRGVDLTRRHSRWIGLDAMSRGVRGLQGQSIIDRNGQWTLDRAESRPRQIGLRIGQLRSSALFRTDLCQHPSSYTHSLYVIKEIRYFCRYGTFLSRSGLILRVLFTSTNIFKTNSTNSQYVSLERSDHTDKRGQDRYNHIEPAKEAQRSYARPLLPPLLCNA